MDIITIKNIWETTVNIHVGKNETSTLLGFVIWKKEYSTLFRNLEKRKFNHEQNKVN